MESYEEIADIIFKNEKYEDRFNYIADRILDQPNMYYDDYCRLDSNEKITEMRFFPNKDNARIYCKEVTIEGQVFCVVMAKGLAKKKSQKIDKSIQQLIDTLKQYEYEYHE
jgi:hypothetical protein